VDVKVEVAVDGTNVFVNVGNGVAVPVRDAVGVIESVGDTGVWVLVAVKVLVDVEV
jgi:hypothetical protein